MENHSAEQNPNACIVCGTPEYEDGYAHKMCRDCRTKMAELKIPNWVKFFALGVVALTLVDAVRLPNSLLAGIHYQRGENAEMQNKYATAEKEFKYVADIFSKSVENNAKLIISSVHNLDLKEAFAAAQMTSGKTSDEASLITEANSCLNVVDAYNPNANLDSLLEKLKDTPDNVKTALLYAYSTEHSEDNAVRLLLAEKLFDAGNFTATDSLLNFCTFYTPSNPIILQLKGATKREMKQYDSAMWYYNRLFDWNSESVIAISGKSRIEFKRHHDAEGMKLAQQAYATDSTDIYGIEGLSLAYYLTGKTHEANAMLAKIKAIAPDDTTIYNRLNNDLTGKTHFR